MTTEGTNTATRYRHQWPPRFSSVQFVSRKRNHRRAIFDAAGSATTYAGAFGLRCCRKFTSSRDCAIQITQLGGTIMDVLTSERM